MIRQEVKKIAARTAGAEADPPSPRGQNAAAPVRVVSLPILSGGYYYQDADYSNGGTRKVLGVAAATKVEGIITNYASASGGSYTIDGTVYPWAKNVASTDGLTGAATTKSYNTWLDAFGFVVYTNAAEAVGDYLLVTKGSYSIMDELNNDVYKVQAVFPDGTVSILMLNNVDGSAASASNAATVGIYSYATASGGRYNLTSSKADSSTADYSHSQSTVGSPLAQGSTVAVQNGHHYFASDVTYIIVKNAGASNIKATVYSGKQTFSTGAAADIYYTTTKSVTNAASGTINLAFVNVTSGDVASTSKDLALVYSKAGSTTVGSKTYTTYNVYINGEKQVLAVDGTPTLNALYEAFEKDSDNVYKFATTVDSNTEGTYQKNITVDNNYVKLSGTFTNPVSVSDDLKVVDVRGTKSTTGGATLDSLSAISSAASEYKQNIEVALVYDNTAKKVTYIYVTGSTDQSNTLSAITYGPPPAPPWRRAATMWRSAASARR